jgi:N-acetylneuraminate synthase
MPGFEVETHRIAADCPPYVIAEAGVHHYGSIEYAKAYILQARIAGVQAIKFQTYTADKLVTNWAELYWNDPRYKTQYDVFKEKLGFTRDQYAELMRYARELGVTFLSTPFDLDSATMLNELGMPAIKIASADLTNFPLLDHVARFGRPVMLSTGAATFDEIEQAVRVVHAHHDQLVLLHCSLAYPTPVAAANLRRLEKLGQRFPSILFGYSDHTQPGESELACPMAVALGARVVEKHFTLNTALAGDDHYHAVDADGLKRLMKNCRDAFDMLGAGEEVTSVEAAARRSARRSIVAARPLKAGAVLSREDLDYKRPGHGLAPSEAENILGKTLLVDIGYDALITPEQLR